MKRKKNSHNNIIPGYHLSMGITISMLSLIVLIPLASILLCASSISFGDFIDTVTSKQVVSAYIVSIGCALTAALINSVFGVIIAYVLVRYEFFGKRFLDGLIELPFALPTAVAGIALTTLYSDQGLFGKFFARLGIQIAYSRIGITIAMIFVGIPFVVRSTTPVLEKLDRSYEEAASMLGAKPAMIFFHVIFPELFPAVLTGFGLALARGIGEYGSVVFIAGNIPYKTQIAPLVIMSKLEQFNYADATSIALVLLALSFILLFLINTVQIITSRFIK